MIIPAVNAGIPQNLDRYLKVDLEDSLFYIHEKLIDRNIEVYWIVIEGTGRLAARDY